MVSGYKISTNKSDLDFNVIHSFISNTYWAKGIPAETMQKAIDYAMCFGVFTDRNEQVGFARVITDTATFAYLSDVFILDAHRGKGLSKWLMEEIVAHPDLQNLRRFVLVTKDAHGLYEQFGFGAISHPDDYMEKWEPNVYQSK
ncbi:GNAT family N-acetyltransferase [Cellvibrio fibrivorans]|uniref:N-acetylglutamate synthase-like GNAT family acetyltransferase n=1 Tax=Cellvibrio fibrivorans TaxID=126350 RepID=A0ABU1UW00_9GAMM|nr:GNAT family N-acetyltransferase [Cellvibrio fibrivorans]MDR7089370.1 N-acetylglutamate synthase-like GNAT family acetyltransferase [Cellvibrio fibrivorans]